jgi:hypothetical protein
MAKTVALMIVYQPAGLHKGVADCGADEFETTLL